MRFIVVLVAIGTSGLGLAACGPSTHGPGDDAGDDTQTCDPGATEACYTGADGTEGVGPCTGGERTCGDDGFWGDCDGEVTPQGEACGDGEDNNCNGEVDEDVDSDGDGFTTCGGDCCDSSNVCSDPDLVNPGAFESAGNSVDDDCDGAVDNVAAAMCDTGLTSNSADALDYARAMDLCQFTTEAGTEWGVIDAAIVETNGSGAPANAQRAIRPTFGGIGPQNGGAAFAVLSTGHAAATGQTQPNFQDFQLAEPMGGAAPFPADWLAANGGDLPNAPGCPAPDGTDANDPVMLQIRVRTPTNARSFKLKVNFLSSEYPEWTCTEYNDFFVVLLDSTYTGTPENPADKNLAVYTSPTMAEYPVGVNLAYGNTGLFTQCVNGPTGCAGADEGTIDTCTGTSELVGTGMDVANPPSQDGLSPGYCGGNNLEGGGTGWLSTSGNVVGGEIITLRIAVWDTSDGIYDSVAVIDGFEWSVESSDPGTVIE
jgi:hypothetical protein